MKQVKYGGESYVLESNAERQSRLNAVTQELWEVCKNNGTLSVFDVEQVAEKLKNLARNTIIR